METNNANTWPPSYNLRLSRKAKHAHLKVIPNQGLEVVIPVRLQKRIVVADLLAEKKEWIQKHLATLQIQPLTHVAELHLQAINQFWDIQYVATAARTINAIARPGTAEKHTLVLYGNVADIALTHEWLKKWLKEQAREHLLPWLYALSIETELHFNKASIRAQQTLWGSCTVDKNISLNYKLLFIPPLYAEHIMLHELCHTKHLNHSQRFWNLLAKVDPKCEQHNRAVRDADRFVPVCFNYT